MAIKTKYNFKGIEVKDAVIKVNRLFGSKQEGWNSLVGVYNITTEEVPAVEAKEAYTKEVYNLLEEFNHSASYVADERGYVSLYKSLTEKFGGEEV
jgi:hypothetical protein